MEFKELFIILVIFFFLYVIILILLFLLKVKYFYIKIIYVKKYLIKYKIKVNNMFFEEVNFVLRIVFIIILCY